MDDFDIKWKNHSAETIEVVKRLREHDAFMDVWLYCETDGKTVCGNKTILAACSAFFERIFVEIQTDDRIRSPVVVLRDVQSRLLLRALDFMYTGEVMIPSGDLTAFVQLAESLEIRGLQGTQPTSAETDVHEDVGDDDGVAAGEVPDVDIGDAAAVDVDNFAQDGVVAPNRKREARSKPKRRAAGKGSPSESIVVSSAKRKKTALAVNNDPDTLNPDYDDDEVLVKIKPKTEEPAFDDVGEDTCPEDDYGATFSADTPQNIPAEISESDPISRKTGFMWRGKRKDNRATVFFCEVCGHIATKSTHAEDHNRVHTGERPFRCRVCDRSFTQKSHRNKHEVTIHSLPGGRS